jgi:hypothetical protein
MPDQNPIYDFLKSNKLTDLDEKSFVNKYSDPDKAKEIHSFFVENKLTDLDSAGFYDKYLKKKVGGEEFSPTELPSVSRNISLTQQKPTKDYYNTKLEKGLIFDKEGKLYAPSSEALSKAIAPAEKLDLKKSTQKDLVEKSREMVVEEPEIPVEKQGWLLNTVSALDKGFAKNFISSPIKGLGTILQGATKKVMGGTGEGYISDNLIKFGDYLNKAIDEVTPQDEEFKNTLWDQAAQALGQVGSLIATGGIAGAGKGATAALVSEVPKGAAITAAKTLGSQLSSPTAVSAGLSMGQAEFDRAKEAGATDDQAFEAFYKNAAVGSVLETIPVMQFFKRFNNSTGGSVANYIKTKGVAGLTGGIEEMTTEVMQQLYSNKTAKDIYNINQDILDGVGSSGGVGFGVGFLLNAMGANAKILRKQGKVKEADVLENQVKQYEGNLENPKVTSGKKIAAKDIVTQGAEIGTKKAVQSLDRDLANNVITPEQYQESYIFIENAAQVADKIPETVTGESRAKSIELLVERNDINQANQNLLQQKQTTDVAYHAGIDEEIKANEEKIKKLDAEVYDIAKKPSKEFGGKKYIVDGEEVSKEAFEALQAKPIEDITQFPETLKAKPVKELTEKQLNNREKSRIDDVVDRVENGDIKGSSISVGDKDLTEELIDKGLDGREAYMVKDTMERLINPLKNLTDKIDPQEVKFFTENVEDMNSVIEGLEDARTTMFLRNKDVVDNVNKEAKRLLDYYSDKNNLPENKLDNEKTFEATVDLLKKFLNGDVNYLDLSKFGIEKSAKDYYKTKEKVKPTEVKQPTKELAEGEEVAFNTPEGKKLTGEKITIPGFEKIDMVMVKDGLNYTVYDLASGSGLVEGDFSKEGAIESLINQFKEKNITQPKIYNLIYKGTNTSSLENKNRVPQINPSSMFESYSEKRKAFEKAEYEKLPLKFNPEEIKKLKELKKRAEDFGIDKMAKEIEDAIISRAKEGTFKPNMGYYENLLKKDIDEKIKKEAEDKGVPYPKEYLKETPRITINKLKEIINEGFKRDKFESIPQDIRKIMLDGYQKNIDILNKYGYYPDEKTKDFFDKLYQYVAAQTKRENRELQIADAKKELISALDYLNKAHEKEFGKKAEAQVKPKEGEVKVYNAKDLRENAEVLEEDENYHTINYPKSFDILYTSKEALNSKNLGSKKIGDVINIFNKDYVIADYPLGVKNKVQLIRVDKEGNLLRRQDLKGKLEKINYKDIVNNPKIFQENKDEIVGNYYGMSSTKSSVPALNKIKREIKVGDKINWGGDYVVLEVKGDKNNPNVYLADIDKDGNLIRIEAEEIEIEESEQQVTKDDLKKAEAKFASAKDKFEKAKAKVEATQVKQAGMFGGEQKGMFAMGGEEAKATLDPLRKATKKAKAELDDIRNRIKVQEEAQPELKPVEETPYQKALREKQEAEKKQTRQFAAEKATVTKEIYRKVSQTLRPLALGEEGAQEIALRYLADGGKVSKAAVDEAYGTAKRAELNTGRRELLSEEVKSKDFVQGNESLDDTVHGLWQDNKQRVSERDIKDKLMAEIGNNNTRLEAAEAYLDQYNAEYQLEKEELRLAEQEKEKYLEEQEQLEKELRTELDEQIEGEASEENINNLIEQYEAEIKAEDQQLRPESEREINKEIGKTKAVEKTSEEGLAKEYKEVVGKASKKAKENAKKDFVDRNFDNIVEKLKIQIKCPT